RGRRGRREGAVGGRAAVGAAGEIASNAAKLAEYGVDPAAAEARLDVSGRSEPLVLLLGAKSPTGAWVYAKEGGKPAVVTLSEITARDATRTVSDFRDKTIVAFDRKNVSAIDLDVNGSRFSVAADEPATCPIVTPAH